MRTIDNAATPASGQRQRRSLAQWVLRLPADMRTEWMLSRYERQQADIDALEVSIGSPDKKLVAAAEFREAQYAIVEAASSVSATSIGDVRRKMALLCRHLLGGRDPITYDAGEQLAIAILRDLETLEPDCKA
jgi:hypothetical protein